MTTRRVGRLNVTVELNKANICGIGIHEYDIVVSNDAGTVLYIEQEIYSRSERKIKEGQYYMDAVEFAERYNLLLELTDIAMEKADMRKLRIISRWMEEMKGA